MALPPNPLLPVRTVVILLLAAFAGIVVGLLAFLREQNLPGAVLLGLGACGIALPTLHSLIGR